MSPLYRQIPAVNTIVDAPLLSAWRRVLPRATIVTAVRQVLAEYRARLAADPATAAVPRADGLAQAVARRLQARQRGLYPVINATGILIHTGLGRAPLAEPAVRALAGAARHYTPVEIHMPDGERGHRARLAQDLLCSLTGAQAATVVNNNAAALLLVLTALARDREVIISRGELIEIGGGFRLPEVMAASGALLREVGATNKTRSRDYGRAIRDTTAALLKVHPSNFRIRGFTEETSIAELAALAEPRGLPVLYDIGSGLLRPPQNAAAALVSEPNARSALAAGADLVLFSGDKLLGGPQAGIIVGRKALLEKIETHPLMRPLRVDKLTLAALAATLQLHQNLDQAAARIPVLRMLGITIAALEQRAQPFLSAGVPALETEPSAAYLGGGALPDQAIPSLALRLPAPPGREQELARRLRLASPAVLPRIRHRALYFDLRTVFPEQDQALLEALRRLSGSTGAH